MRFYSPYILLLVPIILIIAFFLKKRKTSASIRYSNVNKLKVKKYSFRVGLIDLPFYLRILTIIAVIIALARPQSNIATSRRVNTEGIDIILTLDVSGSMRAEDFKPKNRLHVAKRVVADFIKGRSNDRIGLVVFAGEAYSLSPLTLDYGALLDAVDDVNFNSVEEDGTAIGSAIVTSLNRLRKSKAKSKIIILLTDGRNNSGNIDPLTAAELAKTLEVKIYTIGVGTKGKAPYPQIDPIFGKRYVYIASDIDDKSLQSIATTTGASYYRATNAKKLKDIYEKISKMEKTKIQTEEYINYDEKFQIWVLLAFIFFVAELLLKNTYLRKIP